MFLLANIQLDVWKELFKNNSDSNMQVHYYQMFVSLMLYSILFLLIICITFIFFEFDDLIKTWRETHWRSMLNVLIIIMCYSWILVYVVCPSKAAQSFAQNIIEVISYSAYSSYHSLAIFL